MKWQSRQWRVRGRGGATCAVVRGARARRAALPPRTALAVLAALALGGALPAAAHAQGGAPAPGADALCRCFAGDDSTRARARERGWALLGAAGLAVLAGIPIGSSGMPAIPFVEGPPVPPPSYAGGLAATPADAPAAPTAAPAGVRRPGGPADAAPEPFGAPPSAPAVGLVPPRTATHLPLLAAAGVLLMGGGGLLARRQARQQRRRRRRLVPL